jgi:hypothetical protein
MRFPLATSKNTFGSERDQIRLDDNKNDQQGTTGMHYHSDEDLLVVEDESDDGDREDGADDGSSSSISIPDRAFDVDLVYAVRNFVAEEEGQASLVKGDRLTLLDDSHAWWWLVRVLGTRQIGYVPVEAVETPFERLARFNKHRNFDVCLCKTPIFCILTFV